LYSVVEIFRHRQLNAPDWSCQEHRRKRAPITFGAPIWCRPKTLRRENKYPYLSKVKNTCEQYILMIIKSSTFSIEIKVYLYLLGP